MIGIDSNVITSLESALFGENLKVINTHSDLKPLPDMLFAILTVSLAKTAANKYYSSVYRR